MRYATAAFTVLLLLVPLPSSAEDDGPALTFAELSRSSDIKPGKVLIITLRLHGNGPYEQMRTKLVGIDESTMRVRVGENFAGARTDLNIEYIAGSESNLPFAELGHAILEIPEHRVLRVATVDSLANGALIGAGIGAAPAALLAALACSEGSCEAAGPAAAIASGAAIGASIGILADYGRRREGTVLFHAPAAPRAVEYTVAPIVSRERKGAMFVIRW